MSAHRGKRSALPSLTDLAADLRDGHALADLAAAWEVNATHLAQRLNRAGWDAHGRPASDERPTREPVVGFTRGDTSWMDAALCAQIGGDFWFPENGGSIRDAKAVCDRCPVQRDCLDHGLAVGGQHGVYGGMTERKRRGMRGAA